MVLLYLNRRMKGDSDSQPNRFARWALIGIAGAPLSLGALMPIAHLSTEQDIKGCNRGSNESCARLLAITSVHSQVTNPYLKTLLKEAAEKERLKKIALDKQKDIEEKKRKQEQLDDLQRRQNDQKIAQARAEEKARINAEEEAANQKRLLAERQAKARKEFVEWATSSSPLVGCKSAVRRQLRDPGSYEDDFAQPRPIISKKEDSVSFIWSFRAKNGFGGYSQSMATCITRRDTSDSRNSFGLPKVGISQM